jgi:hypothetical protein
MFSESRQTTQGLQTITAMVVIAALVTVFWWPTLFGGKTLVHGDSIVHGLPLMDLHARALRGEASVLWSSDIYGGHPLFAEGQGAFAHPLNIVLAALVPPLYGHNLFHFICMLLLALGTVGLCRSLGASAFASAFAALAATFASINVGAQQNLTISGTITWVPWALWAMEAWLRRPDALRALLLGAACCLLILAGYPQVFHGAVVYMAVSLLVQPCTGEGRAHLGRSWRRLLGSGVVAVLLCAGLAAVQVLPLLELTQLSHRSDGIGMLPITPGSAAAYWRGFLYTLDGMAFPPEGYFPATGSILVCAAALLVLLLRTPLRAKGHLLATLLLIQLGIGVSSPLFRVIHEHHLVPGIIFFRTMATYLNVVVIGVAVLAALGIDALTAQCQRMLAAGRRPLLLALALAGCAVMGFVAWRLYSPVLPLANGVIAAIAAGIVVALIGLGRTALLPVLLFAALAAECLVLHVGEIRFVDRAALALPATREQLQQAMGGQRYRFMDRTGRSGYVFSSSHKSDQDWYATYVIAAYTAMTNLLSDMSSIHGALALPLKRRALLEPLLFEETEGRSAATPGQRAIDVLALRYVTTNHEAAVPTFRAALRQPPLVSAPGADIDTWFMENEAVKPPVQAYTRHVAVDSVEAAVALMRTARDDALIVEAPAGALAPAADNVNDPQAITLAVREASATRYVIDVDAARAGWVFVADANYPGWTASVDGNETSVYSAQILGKAVPVTAGRHRVEIRFESRSFRLGLIITLASLLVAVFIVARAWRAQRRLAHDGNGYTS